MFLTRPRGQGPRSQRRVRSDLAACDLGPWARRGAFSILPLVFIYDFAIVGGAYERVEAQILTQGKEWLSSFAAPACARALREWATDPPPPQVDVRLGPPRSHRDGVNVPMTWVTQGFGAVAGLDADVRVAPLTRTQTHLSLAGICSLASRGTPDWTERLHALRLTELSVRTFLRSVAARVEESGTGSRLGAAQRGV
jgi:hypothetical protein